MSRSLSPCRDQSPQAVAALHRDAQFGNGEIATAGQMLAGARSALKTAPKDAFKWSMVMMLLGPRPSRRKIGAELSVAPLGHSSQTKATKHMDAVRENTVSLEAAAMRTMIQEVRAPPVPTGCAAGCQPPCR